MEFTFTQAFDGKTGWVLNPMMGIDQPRELHAGEVENLKFQSYFDGFLYNYEEKDHTLELIGNEEVSGVNSHVILLVKASNDSMHIYIDAENFRLVKTSSKAAVGGEFKIIENVFSNYQNVDGILSAFDVKTQVEGITLSHLVYDSYDYTSEIPDSIFEFKQTETPKEPAIEAIKPDSTEE